MSTEQNNMEGLLETTLMPTPTWRLDAESFDSSLIRCLRTNDKVSVIILLDVMSRDAINLLSSEGEDAQKELRMLLDRLACVAAAAIRFSEQLLFDSCVKTAVTIYMSGFDEKGKQRNSRVSGLRMSSPLLWAEMVKRIIALGGFAVRRGYWRAVRQLALQITADRYSVLSGESRYWLSHAITEATNAGIIDTSDTRLGQEGSLIAGALEIVEGEPYLRPDLPADEHRVLQSLLGFDLLATIVVCADAGEFNTAKVYLSFIYWDSAQIEDLLARLTRDEEMRNELFSRRIEDEFLARMLRELAKVADTRSPVSFNWRGRAVTNFINKHTDPSPAK